jgi:FtsP/CotA-like multicopper oxidase with cupredoxin domain
LQRPGWSDALRAPAAEDASPDPFVFETFLEAYPASVEILPGKRTEVWSYDGGVPGPEIRVERGTRVIVHFTNKLPEPTTIHWHGLRIPSSMDGAPGTGQPEVEPGQTFTYDFVVPDAGTFWYHPHVASAAQVGFGLYGALVVEDPEEPPDLGDELTLVLSDMSIEEDGSLQPRDVSGDLATLFGREGFTILVNGEQNPVVESRAGRRQRWRLINAARSRYFQLGLAGHRFTRFGGDGGLIERPVESDTLVLAPGERNEVIVTPSGPAGTELPVRWIPYAHGYGTTLGRSEETIFRLRITDAEPHIDAPLPPLSRIIEPIDTSLAPVTTLQLTRNDGTDGQFALGINGVPAWEAQPLMAAVGDTQVWQVQNTIDFAHPFHLHGFFFQVLEVNGVAPAVREWKDTADVPVAATLSLAVRFDDRPGMWMFHCHILDHADAGMMGMLHLHE